MNMLDAIKQPRNTNSPHPAGPSSDHHTPHPPELSFFHAPDSSWSPLTLSPPPPLALYIHWPYCRALCPYCAFNRYLMPEVDWHAWTDAFTRTLCFWRSCLGPRTITSIFFGGGTPSLMRPDLVAHILNQVAKNFTLPNTMPTEPASAVEITLEINPTDHALIPEFIGAGINRFSMGIQSFDPESLSLLGRKHSIPDIHQALNTLNASGVACSFDLIYGHRLHADPTRWRQDLATAVPFLRDHVSLYELSYEPGTPFERMKHHTLPDDTLLELYHISEEILGQHGFQSYEVSNFAQHQRHSRHNLAYWQYDAFLGIGPGAHSRLMDAQGRRHALQEHPLPDTWLQTITHSGHATARQNMLTPAQCIQEHLLMALRLNQGLPLSALAQHGATLDPAFARRIQHCHAAGLLITQQEHHNVHDPILCLTPQGRLVLNSIVDFLCRDPLCT